MTVNGRPTKKIYHESAVCISSRMSPSAGFEEVIADVIAQVNENVGLIQALPQSVTRQLYCTIIPDTGIPLIKLPPLILSDLSHLGVQFVVDVIQVS